MWMNQHGSAPMNEHGFLNAFSISHGFLNAFTRSISHGRTDRWADLMLGVTLLSENVLLDGLIAGRI
jgi:hypothetical protein